MNVLLVYTNGVAEGVELRTGRAESLSHLSANAAALEMEKVSFSNRRSVVTRKLTVTREFVCPAAAALAEAIAASNPSSSSTLAPLTASGVVQ